MSLLGKFKDTDDLPAEIIACLIPISSNAIELVNQKIHPSLEIEVISASGRISKVLAVVLSLSRPPKTPALGYTFGRRKTSDILLPIQGVGSKHFRIRFNPDSGILLFSDESPNGLPFRNSIDTATADSSHNRFQTHLKNVPLEETFIIGKEGQDVFYIGALTSSMKHQTARRQYLTKAFPKFLNLSYCLSPPRNTPKFAGFQTWDLLEGTQYQVMRLEDGGMFAGKFLSARGGRLWRERRLLAEVKHDHVVRLEKTIDLGDRAENFGRNLAWTVMLTEFCPHRDLSRHKFQQWPQETVWALMEQVSAGLEHVHELGIIHGNITPENILIMGLDPLDIRISNFGRARREGSRFRSYVTEILTEHRYTEGYEDSFTLDSRRGVLVTEPKRLDQSVESWTQICERITEEFSPHPIGATDLYAAPEAGDVDATTAADIWSLGMIGLSYRNPPAVVYRTSVMKLTSFHNECETLGRKWPYTARMLLTQPGVRATAAKCHEIFRNLQLEAERSQPGTPARILDDDDDDCSTLMPHSPGYDHIFSIDPHGIGDQPNDPGGKDGDGSDDDEEDELKFKFKTSQEISNLNGMHVETGEFEGLPIVDPILETQTGFVPIHQEAIYEEVIMPGGLLGEFEDAQQGLLDDDVVAERDVQPSSAPASFYEDTVEMGSDEELTSIDSLPGEINSSDWATVSRFQQQLEKEFGMAVDSEQDAQAETVVTSPSPPASRGAKRTHDETL